MNYLPITFAFLGLFNYGSAQQAVNACKEWVANGPTYEESYQHISPLYTHDEAVALYEQALENYNPELTCLKIGNRVYPCKRPELTDYTNEIALETRTRFSPLRYCKSESVTNQWLGFQRASEEDTKGTVRKHFRF